MNELSRQEISSLIGIKTSDWKQIKDRIDIINLHRTKKIDYIIRRDSLKRPFDIRVYLDESPVRAVNPPHQIQAAHKNGATF